LARVWKDPDKAERVAELEGILTSVVVIDRPDGAINEVVFGSTVTVEAPDGAIQTHTVVGVDELDSVPDAVSWISPIGKSLLSAGLGDRVSIGEQLLGKIVKIEYRDG
jgi:transcription elongation GreA/GreB family factor